MLEKAIRSCAKKNSCSVKLWGGPRDHDPRKIPVKERWIIILQNNSKCLLLNVKQIPYQIQFSLLDEIQNTKKMNTQKSKEKRIENKVRETGWVVLIFI